MKDRNVTILGCDLHYVEHAPEDAGKAVLFVHGNLGSCRWYERVMELPGLRTVAVDLPNCGRSGRIPSHDIPTYGDHVAGFIEAVADGAVTLVGHSLGGAVAMSVACSRPELVDRMMLVDPAPVEGLVTPSEHFPAIEAYRRDEDQLRAALKTVVPTLTDEAFFDQLVADARLMKGEAYVGHAQELGKADFRPLASRFQGPVLVIRGGQDWLVTAEMAGRTAEAFGGTVREYPSVGHSMMVEAPGEFAEAVVRFVTEE